MFDAELHNAYKFDFSGSGYILVGTIKKDKKGRFFDGQSVRTSLVQKIEDGIAYTLNTKYKLIGGEYGS